MKTNNSLGWSIGIELSSQMFPIAMPLSSKKKSNSDDHIVFLLMFIPFLHRFIHISLACLVSSKFLLRHWEIRRFICYSVSVQKEGILFISRNDSTILAQCRLKHNKRATVSPQLYHRGKAWCYRRMYKNQGQDPAPGFYQQHWPQQWKPWMEDSIGKQKLSKATW